MLLRSNAPLSVDVAKMYKVDPRNAESLYEMWTVFSKCADSIEGGKRYENLSWRLWSRETFCCPSQPSLATRTAIDVVPQPSSSNVPELAASVDSIASFDSDDSHKDKSSVTTPEPQSLPEYSALSRSRGHEKHITPSALKKMVVNIQDNIQEQPKMELRSFSTKAHLSPLTDIIPGLMSPAAQTCIPAEDSRIESLRKVTEFCDTIITTATTTHDDHRGSDIRSGGIVHGFILSQLSVSLSRNLSRQKNLFFRDAIAAHQQQKKMVKGSHDFTDEDEAIASSGEEGDTDTIKLAIDEEDEDDWEDSNSDNDDPPVVNETSFKKVAMWPDLVSRRSMLTTAIHGPERATALASAALYSLPTVRRTRQQSRQGPSVPISPDEDKDEVGLTMNMPGRSRPRSVIMTTSNTNQPAHSPRTTRRDMMSRELTKSLRKNLLRERQQMNTIAYGVLKPRDTARNKAESKAYSVPAMLHGIRNIAKDNSWNHCFDSNNEYGNTGW